MSHRDTHPSRRIVDAVIDQKGDQWGESTRKVARSDAERILEALVAEYGVETAMLALDHQGFEGNAYRHLLTPLFQEAQRRRLRVPPHEVDDENRS